MFPEFTDEENDLRRAVADFRRRECAPGTWDALDQAHQYPYDLMRSIGKAGWMEIVLPPDGEERDPRWATQLGVVTEELGRVGYSLSTNYLKVVGYGDTIRKFGTEAQKAALLPSLMSGEAQLALSLTEPEAGSDAANIQTRAVRQGDEFVLTGSKSFSTCSAIADQILLVARTSGARKDGISVFLVPPSTEGVHFDEVHKLGIWTNPTFNISLDGARVPADALLGEEGRGWEVVTHSLDVERFGLACAYLGSAQDALDYALDYANQRKQFGRTIGSFQVLQHKLVDMYIAVDHARLVTYRVAELLNDGQQCHREAALAKLVASEAYMKVAHDGLQILGGMGYTMETPLQRHFRDAKLGEIGGGSSEIMRNILASQIGVRGHRVGA